MNISSENILTNDDDCQLIPQGISGPSDINEWFTLEGVEKAKSYYHKVKSEGNSTFITEALNFLILVKQGYADSYCNSPQTKRIKANLMNINEYLMLSNNGEYTDPGPLDLGNQNLNQLTLLIHRLEKKFDKLDEKVDKLDEKFNEKFDKLDEKVDKLDEKFDEKFDKFDEKVDKLDEKFDEKFDKLDEKFDKLDEKFDEKFDKLAKRVTSNTAWISNQFKGKGGSIESGISYKEILNENDKYPSDLNLVPLISMNQINNLNGDDVNTYLNFYGLPVTGTIPIRKKRLILFIGVHQSIQLVLGEEI